MENGFNPAFPLTGDNACQEMTSGLTKREYFASAAMQGMMSSYNNETMCYRHKEEISAQIAICIDWADELLNQLNN